MSEDRNSKENRGANSGRLRNRTRRAEKGGASEERVAVAEQRAVAGQCALEGQCAVEGQCAREGQCASEGRRRGDNRVASVIHPRVEKRGRDATRGVSEVDSVDVMTTSTAASTATLTGIQTLSQTAAHIPSSTPKPMGAPAVSMTNAALTTATTTAAVGNGVLSAARPRSSVRPRSAGKPSPGERNASVELPGADGLVVAQCDIRPRRSLSEASRASEFRAICGKGTFVKNVRPRNWIGEPHETRTSLDRCERQGSLLGELSEQRVDRTDITRHPTWNCVGPSIECEYIAIRAQRVMPELGRPILERFLHDEELFSAACRFCEGVKYLLALPPSLERERRYHELLRLAQAGMRISIEDAEAHIALLLLRSFELFPNDVQPAGSSALFLAVKRREVLIDQTTFAAARAFVIPLAGEFNTAAPRPAAKPEGGEGWTTKAPRGATLERTPKGNCKDRDAHCCDVELGTEPRTVAKRAPDGGWTDRFKERDGTERKRCEGGTCGTSPRRAVRPIRMKLGRQLLDDRRLARAIREFEEVERRVVKSTPPDALTTPVTACAASGVKSVTPGMKSGARLPERVSVPGVSLRSMLDALVAKRSDLLKRIERGFRAWLTRSWAESLGAASCRGEECEFPVRLEDFLRASNGLVNLLLHWMAERDAAVSFRPVGSSAVRCFLFQTALEELFDAPRFYLLWPKVIELLARYLKILGVDVLPPETWPGLAELSFEFQEFVYAEFGASWSEA